MNSHRLMQPFQDTKTEVTIVKQAQSAEMAKTGDAMDVDAFSKGSVEMCFQRCRKGQGTRRSRAGTARTSAIELPAARNKRTSTKDNRRGAKKGDGKGKGNKKDFKGKCFKCGDEGSHVERLQVQRSECI